MISLLSALALASQPLPQGERLPPPDFGDKDVIAAIDALFGTFAAGDAAGMLKLVDPDGRVTASGLSAAGSVQRWSWTQFAARITPASAFEERIGKPLVLIDDDVAAVWAPFVVRVRGKVQNCGIDHFDLVRRDGVWIVTNLTFSSRTEGCGA